MTQKDLGSIYGVSSRWITLAVLFVIGVFNFMDRTLIGILQIPLKADLHISDTQLGALAGTSFALVYTLFGLPMGRIADRTSRKWVLCGAVLVWSSLTALSGMATGFATLLICRMGVALGEAACAPLSHSLISDTFPKERRATAVGVWALTVPAGVILGFLVGGWLSSSVGWRKSFYMVGGAGVIVVLIVVFLLRDPARHDHGSAAGGSPLALKIWPIFSMIWSNNTYRLILLAASFHLLTFHSVTAWLPQFYARVYHLPIRQIGATMALILGVGGAIGTLIGGFGGDRLAERDPRWRIWMSAIASTVMVPLSILQFWAPSLAVSVTLGVVNGALLQVFFAPMIAITQSLMPQNIRAFTGAIYVAFVNVFAMGLGPLGTGALTDVLGKGPHPFHDPLRISLSVVEVGSLVSIGFFVQAARHYMHDAESGPIRPDH